MSLASTYAMREARDRRRSAADDSPSLGRRQLALRRLISVQRGAVRRAYAHGESRGTVARLSQQLRALEIELRDVTHALALPRGAAAEGPLMPKLTERIVTLLRVMHAGIPLRVLPKGTAMLDTSKVATGVRRATVEQMEADGLIVFDPARTRYEITEAGRDQVRVRDHVAEFFQDVS